METSSQTPASFGQGLELASIVLKAIATIAKKKGLSSEEIQEKLIGKPGEVYKCIENLFSVKPAILKLISAGKEIIIEASDGKALISSAKNIFKSHINPDFTNWGLNKVATTTTTETLLNVYEMVSSATFVQMFSELNTDLDKLVMTQSQIIRFCEKYPTWLRQGGYATFFLTKVNKEYFVVDVRVVTNGLFVNVIRFGNSNIFNSSRIQRLVSPQLES